MNIRHNPQTESQISDTAEQQVEEFRQNLNTMTGFYRKSIYMVAANRIRQELEEIDNPDPPKILNLRRMQDLLVQPIRFIASRIAPANIDKSQGRPVVIDIPPKDVIDIE